MAKNNAINLDVTPNADGFSVAGGTTKRTLTVTGGDITLTGGATTKGDILASDGTDFDIITVGTNGQVLTADSAEANGVKWATASGTGDVVGPASATDNAIARYDTTTGKLIQNSSVVVTDSGTLRLGGASGTPMIDIIGATTAGVQGLRIQADGAGATSFSTYISGDSFVRFSFLSDGTLKFGDGTVAGDTNLYRNAANELKTDDAFTATGTLTALGTLELGNASDTTLSRSAAGVLAVEGVVIPSISSTNTLTNKRVQPRTASSTTAATLTPDLSSANVYYRTTQTATLTIEAPTGTPVIGETILIYVDSVGAEILTIDPTYIPFGEAFPATTTAGKTFMMSAQHNGTNWKTLWANAV